MFGTATMVVGMILFTGVIGAWYATHPRTVKRLIKKLLEKTQY